MGAEKMSALDDHIAHSVWCGVWEAHRNDDGELQSGPCSCDVDRARQELSALRAENSRMREMLEELVEAHDWREMVPSREEHQRRFSRAIGSARAALGGREKVLE